MENVENKMLDTVVNALQDKLAKDIVSLKVGDATPITDYFVIATATNTSQMDAMIDGVEEAMKDAGFDMKTREGRSQGGWVLLDYGSVIVHIFSKEARQNYNLEKLYQDGDEIDITHLIEEN